MLSRPLEFCAGTGKLAAAHDMELLVERSDGARIVAVVNIRPLTDGRGLIHTGCPHRLFRDNPLAF